MADDTTPCYRCSAYTIDPTATDDITKGFQVGARWVNTTSKRAFLCTDCTATHAMWICSTVPSAKVDIVHVNFSTASTTYQTAITLPFICTCGSMWQSVKVIASTNSGTTSDTFDFRLIDVTNGNTVVGESTGLYSTTKQFFNLGTLSNLPSDEAVFELQLRNSGSSEGSTTTVFAVIVMNN